MIGRIPRGNLLYKIKCAMLIKMFKPMFKLVLELNGETYKAKGELMSEAFGELGYPLCAKAGTLKITKGKKNYTQILYPHQLRKLSANKIFRQLLDKRLRLHFE